MSNDYKELRKSATNKTICGVCGGVGEYFKVDPTLIRLLWVVISPAKAKINTLGVSAETIEKYGTVSEFTAKEMAECARNLSDSDIGLSVTGVAGPDPTENKPVGLVYIALSDKNKTIIKKLNIENNGRDFIRESAAEEIFNLLINYLNSEEN